MSASGGESLVDLVDRVGEEVGTDGVSVDDLRKELGRRAFGPFLIIAGLLATLPTGMLPGMTWGTGAVMCLVLAQVMAGAQTLWLPGFIARRSLSEKHARMVLDRVRPWANGASRWVKPRLEFMLSFPMLQVTALAGLVNALTMFPLGSIPFGAFPGGVAAIVIGIGLVMRDGVMMLLGIALGVAASAGTVYLFRLL